MTSKTKLDRAIEKLGKKRAFNLLHAHMANVSAGIEKPKQDISFQEFVDKWRSQILPTFKPSTRIPIESHLTTLLGCFSNSSLVTISTEAVQQWVSSRIGSPKTTINLVGTLKQLCRSAKAWNYLANDPTEGVKLPERGLIETPELTPEQALEVIRKAEEPYKTLFWIVAETGMRGGEVCGLFTDDVDFDRQMIHVRRSAWRGQLQTPKSGNAVRQFPISKALSQHLKEFIYERNGKEINSERMCVTGIRHSDGRSLSGGDAGEKRPELYNVSNSDQGHSSKVSASSTGVARDSRLAILISVSGRPLDNGLVVRDVLRPILKQAGIYKQGMGLHAFRHMNLSVMGSLGVPAKVVQERAGHASYSTSLGYMSGQSKDHQSIAEQLGQMFDPKMEEVA